MQSIVNCRNLEELNVSNTDASSASFGGAIGLSRLRELNLRGCKLIDDAIVPFLLRLPLEQLDVRGCNISGDEIKKLQAGMPGCRIEFTEVR